MKKKIRTYFQENKIWIFISTGIFIAGLILGVLIFLIYPLILETFLSMFEAAFEEELKSIESQNNWKTVYLLFINNFKSCMVLSFGGVIFGFLSLWGLFFNGLIIGIVVGAMLATGNILTLIIGLIPHGIFEIPALIVSGAWGLRLGTEWIFKQNQGDPDATLEKRRREIFVGNLKKFIRFIPIIFAFLLLAALIEVFVSGQLILNMGS